ncbi:TetR family transcriptional regulator [Marinobacterium sp. A346]|uniref:TetR family transcriptional regulator n=2 Tax=Marinobacterium weihaiense TaxID=2851016 RepID=A0ABS6M7C9_9GAMM|nr:TetR family transcriptional regulator [Marinobacterium weihaiense]
MSVEKSTYQTSDTASRIIHAAEKLFAEQGFKETTMRQITSQADVNLAAVNYHFGSKQGLIQSVAQHSLNPLCDAIDAGLDAFNVQQQTPGLDALLQILARALVRVHQRNDYSLAVLMRLLDQAYRPIQQELQGFIRAEYGTRISVFLHYLRQQAMPLSEREFFWRLHFLMGSVIFTLSNMHALIALDQPGAEPDAAAEVEHILQRMVPFICAGMAAPERVEAH